MKPEANRRTHIKLYPLLSSITAATDLISRILVDHHQKVTFVAATIGKALGLEEHSLGRLTLAAAVHDIGGLSIRTRRDSRRLRIWPGSSASTMYTGKTAKA